MPGFDQLLSRMTILGVLLFSAIGHTSEEPHYSLIKIRNESSKTARELTDKLISFAEKENGKGLLPQQMADAYDIFYAHTKAMRFMDENKRIILWIDARPSSGISHLTQLMGELAGAPDKSHIYLPIKKLDTYGILEHLVHKYLTFDDIFDDETAMQDIDTFVFNLSELLRPGSTVLIVDQKGLYKKLPPAVKARVAYVNLHEESCDTQLSDK